MFRQNYIIISVRNKSIFVSEIRQIYTHFTVFFLFGLLLFIRRQYRPITSFRYVLGLPPKAFSYWVHFRVLAAPLRMSIVNSLSFMSISKIFYSVNIIMIINPECPRNYKSSANIYNIIQFLTENTIILQYIGYVSIL